MQIVILCIMGEYRGGKSTFMSFVIEYLEELESIHII